MSSCLRERVYEQAMVKTYLLLTKPGIVIGNAIVTIAGFALASKGNFDINLFLATLFGLSFIIASACVFNNYADREIDKKMERTKQRALVQGIISGPSAIIFATTLGVIGTTTLGIYTNILTVVIALAGFFVYVILYGFWKRRSVYGTVVGSVSGAVPPVVGYTAVSDSLDSAAILLFLILVLWQMPHFFAIAIFRFKDYAAASIPVLPVKKGLLNTKFNMLFYTIAFAAVAPLLTLYGYASVTYAIVASLCGLFWIYISLKGFWAQDIIAWARQMFRFSLVIITLLSTTITIDYFLP